MSNGPPSIEDIAARLQALETTQNLATCIDALDNGINLAGRLGILEAAHAQNQNMADRIVALENATPGFTQQQTIAHEHAGQWLRMVNTTIWTLNSIFLVGSVIVFSNAQAATVSLHWKHTAGWIVIGLCAIWAFADFSYAVSAQRARAILDRLESLFDADERLYAWQTGGTRRLAFWFGVVASYSSIVGIVYLALTNFVWAQPTG
jgi:hypothetical protein